MQNDSIFEYTHINTFDDNSKINYHKYDINYVNKFVEIKDINLFFKIFTDFIKANLQFLASKHNLKIELTDNQLNKVYIDFLNYYIDNQIQCILCDDINELEKNDKLFSNDYPNNVYNQLINKYEKNTTVFLGHFGYSESETNKRIFFVNYIFPILFETEQNKFEQIGIFISPISIKQFAKSHNLIEIIEKCDDYINLLLEKYNE
jgi:hypothetical protein